jgi:hypothetical protein
VIVIPVLLQLKNPLGEQEQELRHRSHFGQGERLCDFFEACGAAAPAAETALMGLLELKPGNPDYLS